MTIRCCNRDHNGDGNCDIHSAPGVYRRAQLNEAWLYYDLITRLRAAYLPGTVSVEDRLTGLFTLCEEAADALEAQRTEIAQWTNGIQLMWESIEEKAGADENPQGARPCE